MIVIGVDPGTIVSGYGIVQRRDNSFHCLHSGYISQTQGSTPQDRLKHIYTSLVEIIDEYNPDEMSIEDVFYAKNIRSTLKLGEARGVSMLAAASVDIPVYQYSPTEVKSAVTGNGRATKEQVQQMICTMLNIDTTEKTDTSDALAIAVCHLHSTAINKKYGFNIRKKYRKTKRFTLNDIPS